MSAAFNRVLLTGAGGTLGRVLRERLAGTFPVLRLSDISEMAPARDGEEVAPCDLSDAHAVERLLDGVDAVIHLGGQAVEADWGTILNANIQGSINLWEAARSSSCRRIVFASSNHAIGFHPRERHLDEASVIRPDSRYGISKCFGEALASYYADKFGISAFCMRIGSCFPEPRDVRMLSTWLSYDDFVRLVMTGLGAPYHFEIVYGVSANTRSWWNNDRARQLGYAPRDDAERFAAMFDEEGAEDAVAARFQGGAFCAHEFAGTKETAYGHGR